MYSANICTQNVKEEYAVEESPYSKPQFIKICDFQHQIRFQKPQKSLNCRHQKSKIPPLTTEEKLKFMSLYVQNRPKWDRITKQLPGRTQRQLKNYFYNNLRNLASKIHNLQKKQRTFQKNMIKNQVLLKLIDLSIFLNKSSKLLGVQPEYDNLLIHQVKEDIFSFCFKDLQIDQEKLAEMIKNIRNLNFRYKNIKFSWSSLLNLSEVRFVYTSIINQSSPKYISNIRKKKDQSNLIQTQQSVQNKLQQKSGKQYEGITLKNEQIYQKNRAQALAAYTCANSYITKYSNIQKQNVHTQQYFELFPLIDEHVFSINHHTNHLVDQYNRLLGITDGDHVFEFI